MILDFFKSIRPLNLLAIMIAQLGVLFTSILRLNIVVCILMSSALLIAAGNIQNDCEDKKLDSECKGKKNRFIDSYYSKIVYLIFYLCSFFFAFLLYLLVDEALLICISVCSIILIYIYNISMKRYAILGNLAISLLCVLSIMVPVIVMQENLSSFSEIVVLLFSYTYIREWVKDIEDKYCDKQYEYKTLAIVLPEKTTSVLISICIMGLLVFLFYSSLKLKYPLIFWNCVFMYFFFKKEYSTSSGIMKIILFMGILELYL